MINTNNYYHSYLGLVGVIPNLNLILSLPIDRQESPKIKNLSLMICNVPDLAEDDIWSSQGTRTGEILEQIISQVSHPNRRDSKNGIRYCDFFSVWSMTFRCFASGEYKVEVVVCSIRFF